MDRLWTEIRKQLWLSRVDRLDDPWEISLAGNQLEHVISLHPIAPLPRPDVKPEGAMERSARIIKMWRRQTFVNCWSASEHESHALWRIYCHSSEGVAVQTTLARLRESVGLPVYRVTYQIPGINKETPSLLDLVTKKRPMFAYEQEVRVVLSDGNAGADPLQELLGHRLLWDPERNVESIRVHPDADGSFMDTVRAVVAQYAPALKDCVAWSDMNALPPF